MPNINHQIKKIVDDVISILYQEGILVQEDDFLYKYKINYEELITKTIDAYSAILDEAKGLMHQRQAERSSRSYWQGGGFGLKGAIKGAVQASAMNAVTGVGRSISDSIVDSGDQAKLQASKKELYKDRQYIENILNSYRLIVFRIDYGLAEELYKAGATERIAIDNIKSLESSFLATKYEKDEKALAKKLFECIMLYPTQKMLYSRVISYIILNQENELDEITRFMKFWDMDEDFSWFFDEMRQREPVLKYINKHPEIKEINFRNYNAATYIQIRDARKALVEVATGNKLPALVSTCSKIDKYLKECLESKNALEPIKTFLRLDDNDTLDSICQKIQGEKEFLPELFKVIWIKGDSEKIPEDKLKNKWGIPQTDVIYLYQNKAIFGTVFGGDGFVLSSSMICDLKSKTLINIIDVSNISYDSASDTMQLSDGRATISVCLSDEKPATRNFVCNCLKEMIKITRNKASYQIETQHDTLGETYDNDNVVVADGVENKFMCASCGKKINQANKFCAFCGAPIIAKINCPSCGKEIKADAKFCNFCGESVVSERTEEVSHTDVLSNSKSDILFQEEMKTESLEFMLGDDGEYWCVVFSENSIVCKSDDGTNTNVHEMDSIVSIIEEPDCLDNNIMDNVRYIYGYGEAVFIIEISEKDSYYIYFGFETDEQKYDAIRYLRIRTSR